MTRLALASLAIACALVGTLVHARTSPAPRLIDAKTGYAVVIPPSFVPMVPPAAPEELVAMWSGPGSQVIVVTRSLGPRADDASQLGQVLVRELTDSSDDFTLLSSRPHAFGEGRRQVRAHDIVYRHRLAEQLHTVSVRFLLYRGATVTIAAQTPGRRPSPAARAAVTSFSPP